MKTYYEQPTQVMFYDIDNPGEWLVGIAHRDEIICACCGGVYEVNEVILLGREDGIINPIYEYNIWIDLVTEISGGEFPDGLTTLGEGDEGHLVETCGEEYKEWEASIANEAAWYFEDLTDS